MAKRRIYCKTDEQIERIRESCHLVCRTLAEVGKAIRPGITTKELDTLAEMFIRDHDAIPAFKGYRGSFPGSLCTSVNECVVHGFPSQYALKEGDIISVDCGVYMNKFYGDSAYTFAIGDVDEAIMKLCTITNESLYRAIDVAVHGNTIGDIGYTVQQFCERKHRYGVVRELVGHGIGKSLHEDPEVPNYGRKGKGVKMLDGLVIAIEPMVNMGRKNVRTLQDGWTVVSKDGLPSAHYEHSVAVRKGKADILSDHSYIQEAITANDYLREIPSFEAVV